MRAQVAKFLQYWKDRVKLKGEDVVRDELLKGKTILLTRKDRMALLVELGIRYKKENIYG